MISAVRATLRTSSLQNPARIPAHTESSFRHRTFGAAAVRLLKLTSVSGTWSSRLRSVPRISYTNWPHTSAYLGAVRKQLLRRASTERPVTYRQLSNLSAHHVMEGDLVDLTDEPDEAATQLAEVEHSIKHVRLRHSSGRVNRGAPVYTAFLRVRDALRALF